MPTPPPSVLLLVAILTGSAIGCGSTPPRDVNYGTNLGADFVPPIVDAGTDGAAGGAAGTGAAGASGGAAGEAAGAAGTDGADVTGLAGADGSANAGGTGS